MQRPVERAPIEVEAEDAVKAGRAQEQLAAKDGNLVAMLQVRIV
jgi:hypothetical protein